MRVPLPERVRPRRLEEVVGQDELVRRLKRMVREKAPASMILWGPPGSGKTTIARVLAVELGLPFVHLSAVEAGVKEIKTLAERARKEGPILLFFDEIHRLNKAQQDYLLPHVEQGLLVLIGATTENPSFSIIPALRSRARVYVLKPLAKEAIRALLDRSLRHPEGLPGVPAEEAALDLIAEAAAGDARRALLALELAADLGGGRVSLEAAREALGRENLAMDKGGDAFYDLISALHKSVRGSHADAALYYLARMLEGGADPLYVARRLVRMAVEDIGLADPLALRIALAAKEAYAFLGSPEGELALAEATLYLALAPKSNRVYRAYAEAVRAAREHPSAPVPLHLRNAPTGLMKALGHGKGYVYYHDDPEGSFAQTYLPEALADARFYEPGEEGWEKRAGERLLALRRRFAEAQRRAVKRASRS